MIASCILVLSVAALIQFFVSYCCSLVAVYSRVQLSLQALELAGLTSQRARGEDFGPLVRPIRLCPQLGDDRAELWAVRVYYSLVHLHGLGPLAPPKAAQAEHEHAGCAHAAGVAVDRCGVLFGEGMT